MKYHEPTRKAFLFRFDFIGPGGDTPLRRQPTARRGVAPARLKIRCWIAWAFRRRCDVLLHLVIAYGFRFGRAMVRSERRSLSH